MHAPTFRRRSALLIALTAGLAACNGQEPGGTTSFSVMLKDAPGDVQHAVVTISEVDLVGSGGVHVLTLDFRGYGESGGDKLTDAAQRRAVVQEKWPGDVDAAYAYLISQKGVDKSHIAAGGASCGVTQSSDLAARHHDIKTLLALSGTATDATRTYIAQTPALAIFGAASEGDAGAAKGIKEILDASKNPRSTVKIYAGTEHGVPMFAKNPELEPMIVSWLKGQILPKGGTR